MSTKIINKAIELALNYGGIDGDHHKMWVIDQILRVLTDCPIKKETITLPNGQLFNIETFSENEIYKNLINDYEDRDEDGEPQYEWDIGIAP